MSIIPRLMCREAVTVRLYNPRLSRIIFPFEQLDLLEIEMLSSNP
jgi:hypothetical protein